MNGVVAPDNIIGTHTINITIKADQERISSVSVNLGLFNNKVLVFIKLKIGVEPITLIINIASVAFVMVGNSAENPLINSILFR